MNDREDFAVSRTKEEAIKMGATHKVIFISVMGGLHLFYLILIGVFWTWVQTWINIFD